MKSRIMVFVILGVGLCSTLYASETALQKHVRFFDRNGDGLIEGWETYEGFRALGVGMSESIKSRILVNGFLGPQTTESLLDPFTINIVNIHRGKHGSDTGIYDVEGNFAKDKFDEMFKRFDADKDKALSESEIETMLAANYTDFVGGRASRTEFELLLKIAGEDRSINNKVAKVLTRETLIEFYKGDLFFNIEAKRLGKEKRGPKTDL